MGWPYMIYWGASNYAQYAKYALYAQCMPSCYFKQLISGHIQTMYWAFIDFIYTSLIMPSTSNEDTNIIIEKCPVFLQAIFEFFVSKSYCQTFTNTK